MPRPYTEVRTNTCEWEEPDFSGTAAAKPGAGAHMAGATRHWAPGEAGSPREESPISGPHRASGEREKLVLTWVCKVKPPR